MRLEQDRCPHCEKKLDAVTSLSDEREQPEPGDVTVCFGCGGFLTFDEDLRHQALEDLAFLLLPLGTRLRLEQLRRQIRDMRRPH